MRSALSALELSRPRRLDEALELMAMRDRPTPLAGGTDLYVYLNAGTLSATRFMDVTRVAELKRLRVAREAVTIGGGVTFRELREHAAIRRRFPSLAAAAAEVGAWQIQNRATLAGNVANASPAGDSLPVLLAHDAVVQVRSLRGGRDIPFAELYRGYRDLALEPDELITAITLPEPPRGARAFFRKVGTRRAQSISKVVFAGVIALERGRVTHARLAYGSMAPVPARARHAEAALLGRALTTAAAAEARESLARDLVPIDDIRSDREYRMNVAGNLLERFLHPLLKPA
ncbi:MAG TPA: xanthine dehydrogenase family protein subunit M [Candidatus Sulfotelmatobacter sp.]|nr:xanthine dehydrogenase family protein subunit M [Candidatus Sulfotelmatobacter sp.]